MTAGKSFVKPSSIWMGAKILTAPMTKAELKATLPMEFPSVICLCFISEALIPKKSSGRVVPMAIKKMPNNNPPISMEDIMFWADQTRR